MGQQASLSPGTTVEMMAPGRFCSAWWSRLVMSARAVDLAVAGLVLGLAAMVRWIYLLDWPAFTDESREVLLSLAVASGAQWPWTNFNTYIGPWHVYLLAAVFKVAGVSILAPRALVLVLNVLAVGLTYWLARRLAGRSAGLSAGLLVSLSPLWVLVNSHIAWSASTTPVYVVGALLAAQVALGGGEAGTRGGGERNAVADAEANPLASALPRLPASPLSWLVLAGLLVGIAGQTHPSGLLLAPALGLAVVWGRAGWQRLRTPWPWLAGVAAVVGYLPILLFNLVIQPGASVAEAEKIGGARGLAAGPLAILGRAPGMWWNELRVVAGMAEPGLLPAWSGPVVIMAVLLVVGLAVVGLGALWRRGERLLPLAVVAQACLPAVTGYTGELYAERYAAPLVAVMAVLVGVGVTRTGGWLAAAGWRPGGRQWLVLVARTLLPAGCCLLPVWSLVAYYQQQTGAPNAVAIATADLLAPASGCIHVVLDQRLALQTLPGGGTMARSLRQTLSLAGVSWEARKVHLNTLRDIERGSGARERGAVVVGIYTPATLASLPPAQARQLTEVYRTPDGSGATYRVVTYRAAGLPVCAPSDTPPPVHDETDE